MVRIRIPLPGGGSSPLAWTRGHVAEGGFSLELPGGVEVADVRAYKAALAAFEAVFPRYWHVSIESNHFSEWVDGFLPQADVEIRVGSCGLMRVQGFFQIGWSSHVDSDGGGGISYTYALMWATGSGILEQSSSLVEIFQTMKDLMRRRIQAQLDELRPSKAGEEA